MELKIVKSNSDGGVVLTISSNENVLLEYSLGACECTYNSIEFFDKQGIKSQEPSYKCVVGDVLFSEDLGDKTFLVIKNVKYVIDEFSFEFTITNSELGDYLRTSISFNSECCVYTEFIDLLEQLKRLHNQYESWEKQVLSPKTPIDNTSYKGTTSDGIDIWEKSSVGFIINP